jgi:ATP synthase protein I
MPDSPGTLRTIGQLSSVGMSFVLALVMGFAAGFWLDGVLGTRPWLSFLGFFLGLAAGVLNVYRVLQATSSSTGGDRGGQGQEPRR